MFLEILKRSAIFLKETCSLKCQRRIMLNIAMSITPYLPLVAKRASVLHGSVLDANYPAKWVSFGCKTTLIVHSSLLITAVRLNDPSERREAYWARVEG